MTPAAAPLPPALAEDSQTPRHVCDAIARRLSGASRSTSRAATERAAAQEVVRVAESLVLAALPIRVDEQRLAEILRITPSDLHAAFALVRGATPYRAMMGARLHAARQVLALYPKLSPAAVAKQCGFPTYGRFLGEWETFFGPDVPLPRRALRKPVRLKARASALRPANDPVRGAADERGGRRDPR